MKNAADSRMMKRSLSVLGLTAVASLAAGYMALADYNRQIEINEHSAELTLLMVDAAHANQMLRQLNSAELEQTKTMLKSSLAYNLKALTLLAHTGDAARQESAKAFLAEIGREQRAHPDYYLASNRKTGFEQSGVMQVVQH
jgi:hypothetical protein